LPKSVKPITADRYAEWINTIPAGVIVFDEEDQIVFVNPSAETFFFDQCPTVEADEY